MSALLWALAVPALIFVVIAPIEPLCDWSIRKGKWWATSVYVSVCSTLTLICLSAILFCVFMVVAELSS